jgi:hypothetical protein
MSSHHNCKKNNCKIFLDSSSDSECESKKSEKCKKSKKGKKSKVDPFVGGWTTVQTLKSPAPPVVIYGTAVFSVDGTAIIDNTAGLGQLSSLIPPSYIDSVFTGTWENVSEGLYQIFITWVENSLTGNTWPTTPKERRSCFISVRLTSATSALGNLIVYSHPLSDSALTNGTLLITESVVYQKVIVNKSLFPVA